jgi:glycosyltransferase involved in cell wall biosynthesis
MAGPTVTVLGSQPFSVLRHHYARCKALMFPGEEDFGIVPVEAMASGRPVVAYGRGGATETVVAGHTGVFFEHQSVDAIIDAVETLEKMDIDPVAIAAHASQFGENVFADRMKCFVDRCLKEAAAGKSSATAKRSGIQAENVPSLPGTRSLDESESLP